MGKRPRELQRCIEPLQSYREQLQRLSSVGEASTSLHCSTPWPYLLFNRRPDWISLGSQASGIAVLRTMLWGWPNDSKFPEDKLICNHSVQVRYGGNVCSQIWCWQAISGVTYRPWAVLFEYQWNGLLLLQLCCTRRGDGVSGTLQRLCSTLLYPYVQGGDPVLQGEARSSCIKAGSTSQVPKNEHFLKSLHDLLLAHPISGFSKKFYIDYI